MLTVIKIINERFLHSFFLVRSHQHSVNILHFQHVLVWSSPFQVLINDVWLVATILNSADLEQWPTKSDAPESSLGFEEKILKYLYVPMFIPLFTNLKNLF